MFGLSDIRLGIAASVLLHAGIAIAFLGPFGSGRGVGGSSVLVSIDGIEVTWEDAEAIDGPQLPQAPIILPENPPEAALIRKEKLAEPQPATPPKKAQRASQDPKTSPSESSPELGLGSEGGGGLLGPLYSQPLMVAMPKPDYPPTARERGIEGRVEIRVFVNPQGSVEKAEVTAGSGSESLDRSALESAWKAHFKPALRAGVPTAAEKTIVVTFSLLE